MLSDVMFVSFWCLCCLSLPRSVYILFVSFEDRMFVLFVRAKEFFDVYLQYLQSRLQEDFEPHIIQHIISKIQYTQHYIHDIYIAFNYLFLFERRKKWPCYFFILSWITFFCVFCCVFSLSLVFCLILSVFFLSRVNLNDC